MPLTQLLHNNWLSHAEQHESITKQLHRLNQVEVEIMIVLYNRFSL